MNAIIFFLRDVLIWTFDTFLVPVADAVNLTWVLLLGIGVLVWLSFQRKYSKEAKNNPDQIK